MSSSDSASSSSSSAAGHHGSHVQGTSNNPPTQLKTEIIQKIMPQLRQIAQQTEALQDPTSFARSAFATLQDITSGPDSDDLPKFRLRLLGLTTRLQENRSTEEVSTQMWEMVSQDGPVSFEELATVDREQHLKQLSPPQQPASSVVVEAPAPPSPQAANRAISAEEVVISTPQQQPFATHFKIAHDDPPPVLPASTSVPLATSSSEATPILKLHFGTKEENGLPASPSVSSRPASTANFIQPTPSQLSLCRQADAALTSSPSISPSLLREYGSFEQRVASFGAGGCNWPHTASSHPNLSPTILAVWGFYFVGPTKSQPEPDCVRCFACQAELFEFELSDTAEQSHRLAQQHTMKSCLFLAEVDAIKNDASILRSNNKAQLKLDGFTVQRVPSNVVDEEPVLAQTVAPLKSFAQPQSSVVGATPPVSNACLYFQVKIHCLTNTAPPAPIVDDSLVVKPEIEIRVDDPNAERGIDSPSRSSSPSLADSSPAKQSFAPLVIGFMSYPLHKASLPPGLTPPGSELVNMGMNSWGDLHMNGMGPLSGIVSQVNLPYCPMSQPEGDWKQGDIIGCKIDLQRSLVFWHVNGKQLGPMPLPLPSKQRSLLSRSSEASLSDVSFYPTISLLHENDCVEFQLSSPDELYNSWQFPFVDSSFSSANAKLNLFRPDMGLTLDQTNSSSRRAGSVMLQSKNALLPSPSNTAAPAPRARHGSMIAISPQAPVKAVIEVTGPVIVSKIIPKLSADQAGLRLGDQIKSINGKSISSLKDAVGIVTSQTPASVLTLSILRGGSRFLAKLTLGAKDLSQEDFAPLARWVQCQRGELECVGPPGVSKWSDMLTRSLSSPPTYTERMADYQSMTGVERIHALKATLQVQEQLSQQQSIPLHMPQYQTLSSRLHTFESNMHSWMQQRSTEFTSFPANGNLDLDHRLPFRPFDVAMHGFVFSPAPGCLSRVTCFACGAVIDQVTTCPALIQRHRQISKSSCPFLTLYDKALRSIPVNNHKRYRSALVKSVPKLADSARLTAPPDYSEIDLHDSVPCGYNPPHLSATVLPNPEGMVYQNPCMRNPQVARTGEFTSGSIDLAHRRPMSNRDFNERMFNEEPTAGPMETIREFFCTGSKLGLIWKIPLFIVILPLFLLWELGKVSCRGVSWCCDSIEHLCDRCCGTCMAACVTCTAPIKKCCVVVCNNTCLQVYRGLAWICNKLFSICLSPCCTAVFSCCEWTYEMLGKCCAPVSRVISNCCASIGRCCRWCLSPVWDQLTACVNFICVRPLRAIWNCLSSCFRSIYQCLCAPIGRVIWSILCAIGRGFRSVGRSIKSICS